MTATRAGAPDRQQAASAAYDRDVSEVYDFFYAGRGQDFAAEAAGAADVILERNPGARTLLDVACGTGEHLRSFAGRFAEVDGVELSASMCEIARAKLPGRTVWQGDMRELDLPHRFDAVTCMTSSLGYMRDDEELAAAIGSMARHLTPGGVLVIDPWWSPAAYRDGYVSHDLVRDDVRTVARLSRSVRVGEAAVHNEAHYLVADEAGIRHFAHVQPLTLFSPEQYLAAVERAGCAAEHLTDHPAFPQRGLFVGVRT